MEIISSSSNSKVKQFMALQKKSKLRKTSMTFALEGQRELFLASSKGYEIDYIFLCPALFSNKEEYPLEAVLNNNLTYEIPEHLYAKMSFRSSTEGVLAVVHSKNHKLSEIHNLEEKSLILVAENIEKPGNIGALLRTADAVGADAFILANPRCDLYNPNVLRSSVGCVFTVPCFIGDSQDVFQILEDENIVQYAAALREDNLNYTEIKGVLPSAVWIGSEDKGLSSEILNRIEKVVKIPMKGMIDSLNLSVSAAVILYEILRQRED